MIKLSENTINILKNFKTINANLVVTPGNKLTTIDEAKIIQGTATVTEQFDTEFGIYDLNEFYSVYDLFDDPELEIGVDCATITDNGQRAKYRFADKAILTHPTRDIPMPPTDVTVTVTSDDLAKIRSAAAVLGHKIVSICGKDGVISAKIVDPKNTTANTFSITLDTDNACKDEFDMQISIANIKVLGGDYTVEICYRLLSKWINTAIDVEYFIALEKTSPGKIN
jgi:hypothetical protein